MFNLRKKVICLTSAASLAATTVLVPTGTPVYAKTEPVEMKSVEVGNWTMGLYFCGSNLESDGSNASNDIIEILESAVPEKFNDDVNIVLMTGGSREWHFKETYGSRLADRGLSEDEIDQIIPEEIDANKIQEYKVNFKHEFIDDEGEKQTIPTIEFIRDVAEYSADDEKVCMGNPEYLKELINDMHNDFPAEHNLLDLWNHGGGITIGVCKDEIVPDDQITLRELLATLDTTDTKGENKLDIIGYDACLMSNYEGWNKLSAYADYGVGSLTTEPLEGWYYTPFIEELGENYTNKDYTPADLAECIVDAYGDFFKVGGVYDQLNAEEDFEAEDLEDTDVEDEEVEESDNADAMLCAVDLKKLNNSVPVFGELSDTLLKLFADKDGYEVLREKFALSSFAYGTFNWNSHMIPIYSFLDAIDATAEERIEELGDSTTGYDPIYKALYEKALLQTEAVRKTVGDSLVKAYNGHEGNAFENGGSMSIFMPDYLKIRDNTALFTVDEYADYAVDSRYALYTYYVYNACKGENFQDNYESVFGYNAETSEFTVSVPEEATATAGITIAKFLENSGKYYLASSTPALPETEDCGIIKGGLDDKHYEVMGMPIQTVVNSGVYIVPGKYNGENAQITFVFDEKTGKYILSTAIVLTNFDVVIDFNEGDVITFNSAVYDTLDPEVFESVLPETISKDYVIKAEDIVVDEEEGIKSAAIPVTCVKDQGDVYAMVINVHNQTAYQYGLIPEDFITTEFKVVNYNKLKAFADSKITIAQSEFALTGEKIEPKVLFDGKADKYVEGKDYEVEYVDNIGLGTAKVIIRGIGDYEFFGEKVIEFKIIKAKNAEGKVVIKTVEVKTVVVKTPKQASVKSVKNNKKRSLTVKWKKIKGANGYEVKYARNKKFTKGKKVKTVKSGKKASLTIKKLKKKTYFVKVRAYTLDTNGKKVYGDWSKVKSVKIKR